MTEQVEQWIGIEFCVKLGHSSVETIQMIQKAAAMGNWWLAASSQQCTRSCIVSCVEFFGKIWSHPGDLAPYGPDLATCDFWFFAKLKSPLKGNRFQTIDEIQETTMGQLIVIGRTMWVPKVPTLKGPRRHCPMYNVSCILYLLQ